MRLFFISFYLPKSVFPPFLFNSFSCFPATAQWRSGGLVVDWTAPWRALTMQRRWPVTEHSATCLLWLWNDVSALCDASALHFELQHLNLMLTLNMLSVISSHQNLLQYCLFFFWYFFISWFGTAHFRFSAKLQHYGCILIPLAD